MPPRRDRELPSIPSTMPVLNRSTRHSRPLTVFQVLSSGTRICHLPTTRSAARSSLRVSAEKSVRRESHQIRPDQSKQLERALSPLAPLRTISTRGKSHEVRLSSFIRPPSVCSPTTLIPLYKRRRMFYPSIIPHTTSHSHAQFVPNRQAQHAITSFLESCTCEPR